MDVHAPPSAQTESSACILWNTQCRRTARAGINWEEVFFAGQLGCCCCWNHHRRRHRCCWQCCSWCLTQPHDAVGWSQEKFMFVCPSIGGACAECFLLPLTYTIWSAWERNQRSAAPADTVIVIYIGCALCLLYTLSAPLAVFLHGMWFLLHVMMSSASCFLLFIFISFFFSAAHMFHETPLRQKESWHCTKWLSSHDHFFLGGKKRMWRDCKRETFNQFHQQHHYLPAHPRHFSQDTRTHNPSDPIEQSKKNSREITHTDSHRCTDYSDTCIIKCDISR